MTALDSILMNVWECLPAAERRVLAVLAQCHALDAELARGKFVPWDELPAADRIVLVRAMHAIGDFAVTCAAVLETARGALEEEVAA